jgi:hypothetical protein
MIAVAAAYIAAPFLVLWIIYQRIRDRSLQTFKDKNTWAVVIMACGSVLIYYFLIR